MAEELLYTTVIFKSDGLPSQERNAVEQPIYEEVKSQKEPWDENPIISENGKTSPVCSPLQLVAVGLTILCVSLVVAVITLSIHLNAVISEHFTHSNNLTTQNLQLLTEKSNLERQNLQLLTEKSNLEGQAGELTRERDSLNWTMGVILEFDNFPVKRHCSEKVCKPCLEGWELFRSSCYLFKEYSYSSYWRTWKGSQDYCKDLNADLVVIGSQEEQEFISNHTKFYNDENHGYWIGLSEKDQRWLWVDGSILTVKYWVTKELSSTGPCTQTMGGTAPLASWDKATCSMRNRWICETRTLIKSDWEAVTLH